MRYEKCIYCGEAIDDQTGEGDHVIPGALGEFEGDVHFRGICRSCNNRISQAEQVMLRCGPEAFFRRVVRPALPSSRQRGRSNSVGAMGTPPLTYTIQSECGSHGILMRSSPDDPQKGKMADQLVIHDANGNESFFELFPNMSPERLKRQIFDEIVPPIRGLWLHVSQPRMNECSGLVTQMFPNAQSHNLPTTPVGTHRAKGQIIFIRNGYYYRAVAKIAFHYYLTHNRRGLRGDEPCFAAIRNYIMTGGNKSQFFREPPRRFAVPWGTLDGEANLSPERQWGHVHAADEMTKEVFVYVQMFVGPGCIPDSYYVVLGTIDSDIIAPMSYVWGHCYLYHEVQAEVGFAGRVEAMNVSAIPEEHIQAAGFFPTTSARVP